MSSVTPSEDPAIAALRATLNKAYRISISDGRSFEGVFVCTDREKNIILQDATETSSGENKTKREVGMVGTLSSWLLSVREDQQGEGEAVRRKA